MVCDPATVMLCPLLHWTTYEAGALPLGASHVRVTVQSVTPVTRRFFGAGADCRASAALELPRGASPNRMATMHVECKARFRMVTAKKRASRKRNPGMVGPRCRKERDGGQWNCKRRAPPRSGTVEELLAVLRYAITPYVRFLRSPLVDHARHLRTLGFVERGSPRGVHSRRRTVSMFATVLLSLMLYRLCPG